MKKVEATYDVVPKGTRLLDEYRGDRVTGELYLVIKTPKFGDPSQYLVCLSTLGEWCDCPGGTNHGHCKHTAMVHKYLENQNERQNTRGKV